MYNIMIMLEGGCYKHKVKGKDSLGLKFNPEQLIFQDNLIINSSSFFLYNTLHNTEVS